MSETLAAYSLSRLCKQAGDRSSPSAGKSGFAASARPVAPDSLARVFSLRTDKPFPDPFSGPMATNASGTHATVAMLGWLCGEEPGCRWVRCCMPGLFYFIFSFVRLRIPSSLHSAFSLRQTSFYLFADFRFDQLFSLSFHPQPFYSFADFRLLFLFRICSGTAPFIFSSGPAQD